MFSFDIDQTQRPKKAGETDVTVDVREFDARNADLSASPFAEWLALFEQDAAARLSQHPQLVVLDVNRTQPDVARPCYTVSGTKADGSTGMAVVVPKNLPASSVGGLTSLVTFHGYRLAGNRILGAADEQLHQALLRAVGEILLEHGCDFLLVEDLDEGTPFWSLLASYREQGFGAFVPLPPQERHRIHLTGTAAEYWASLSKNARKNYRQSMKRIGDLRLVRVTRPEQVAMFLEASHRISCGSWQSQQLGQRVQNDSWEHRQLSFVAELGALRAYLLYDGETPLAFEIDHQFRGYVDAEEAGYDRWHADLSPGKLLQYMVIDDLFAENRPEWYDFGGGDAQYKRQFSNHVTTSGNVWLMPPGVGSTAIRTWLRAGQTLSAGARAAIDATGLRTRIRQLIRDGQLPQVT